MADPGRASAEGHVCPVALCPVAMVLNAADAVSVQPEALEHLLAAGRELLLAFKAILESRAAAVAPAETARKVEKIELG